MFPRGLDPVAVFVEAGVNTGGADDYVRCFFERAVFDHLENVLEDAGKFSSSPGEKTGGVGVTVKRGVVGDFVIPGYIPRTSPADEVAFDGIAIGMGTDAAAAVVAVEIGGNRGVGGDRVGNGGRGSVGNGGFRRSRGRSIAGSEDGRRGLRGVAGFAGDGVSFVGQGGRVSWGGRVVCIDHVERIGSALGTFDYFYVGGNSGRRSGLHIGISFLPQWRAGKWKGDCPARRQTHLSILPLPREEEERTTCSGDV